MVGVDDTRDELDDGIGKSPVESMSIAALLGSG